MNLLYLEENYIILSIFALLYKRIWHVIASIFSSHLISSLSEKELFFSYVYAEKQYKNRTFRKEFWIVLKKNDIQNRVYVLEFTKQKKKNQKKYKR